MRFKPPPVVVYPRSQPLDELENQKMTLKQLQEWAQSQIDNTAQPEIRPDIGISILQLIEELEELQSRVKELEVQHDFKPPIHS